MSDDYTILSRDELCRFLNISDTSRQRLEKADPHFPAKIKIGLRRVCYLRSDATRWLMKQRETAANRKYVA